MRESNIHIRPKLIANLVIYQIVWMACILSAALGIPMWGILAALIAVAWHVSQAQQPLAECQLILFTGLIGGLWDSLLVIVGLIQYPSGSLMPWMAPIWIITLWMAFATTFNVCLRWLHGHYGLAAIFGMVGGPLAWWAGLMPVLMRLAAYFDQLPHETNGLNQENK